MTCAKEYIDEVDNHLERKGSFEYIPVFLFSKNNLKDTIESKKQMCSFQIIIYETLAKEVVGSYNICMDGNFFYHFIDDRFSNISTIACRENNIQKFIDVGKFKWPKDFLNTTNQRIVVCFKGYDQMLGITDDGIVLINK